MRHRFSLLVVGMLATGCVCYHRWTKPGASVEDFQQAKLRCSATIAGGLLPDGTTTHEPSGAAKRDRTEQCLRALGWHEAGRVSWTGGSDAEYADPSPRD